MVTNNLLNIRNKQENNFFIISNITEVALDALTSSKSPAAHLKHLQGK